MSTKLCEILPDTLAHLSFERADNQPQFYHLGNAKWGPLPVRLMKLWGDWLLLLQTNTDLAPEKLPQKIPERICKITQVHVWNPQNGIKLVFLIKEQISSLYMNLLEFEPEPLKLKTIALLFADEGGLPTRHISNGLPSSFLKSGIIIKQGVSQHVAVEQIPSENMEGAEKFLFLGSF